MTFDKFWWAERREDRQRKKLKAHYYPLLEAAKKERATRGISINLPGATPGTRSWLSRRRKARDTPTDSYADA